LPETVVAVCVVMTHFTSEHVPKGRPAIVDEPQTPLKAAAVA
jgi:hypothetical protein